MSQIFIPERLVVYVVASDDGLAPNITGGYCSLTVCKPVVRRVARPLKDWVVGMSTNKHGATKLIYSMQVEEKIPFDDFFADERFAAKKPLPQNPMGDNFIKNGHAVLYWGAHHAKPDKMAANLKMPVALCGQNFWYFGKNAPELPKTFHETKLVKGPRRGHKIVDNPQDVNRFYKWLTKHYNPAIYGEPRDKKALFS